MHINYALAALAGMIATGVVANPIPEVYTTFPRKTVRDS